MDIIKGLAYMTVWAIGFIAVAQVTSPFFSSIEGVIGGQGA